MHNKELTKPMHVYLTIEDLGYSRLYTHHSKHDLLHAKVTMSVPKVTVLQTMRSKPGRIGMWCDVTMAPMPYTTRKFAAEWLWECRKQVRRMREIAAENS